MRQFGPELVLDKLTVMPNPNDPVAKINAIGAVCCDLIPDYDKDTSGVYSAVEQGKGNCFARTFTTECLRLPGMLGFAKFFTTAHIGGGRSFHADAILASPDLSHAARMEYPTRTDADGSSRFHAKDADYSVTWQNYAGLGSNRASCVATIAARDPETKLRVAANVLDDETAIEGAEIFDSVKMRGSCEIIVPMLPLLTLAPELVSGDLTAIYQFTEDPHKVLQLLLESNDRG